MDMAADRAGRFEEGRMGARVDHHMVPRADKGADRGPVGLGPAGKDGGFGQAQELRNAGFQRVSSLSGTRSISMSYAPTGMVL